MNLDWQRVLLSVDQLISDALVILNQASSRIVLVVCDEGNLLGVVTDGDVRRGLLRGIGIDRKVTEIMNSKPLIANFDLPGADVLDLMDKGNVSAIPLVDRGKLVGLETQKSLNSMPVKKGNPVFIMAGGFGKRLRPLTNNCPKPMLKLDKRPMLEILLTRFVNLGFSNFYISTHYMPEVISDYFGDGSKWNVKIQYVYEKYPLGTGGALGLLPDDVGDLPIILINGDILTTVDFVKILDFHEKNTAEATLCVRKYEYQVPYGVVSGDGLNVKSMEEKPTHEFFVNAGIYVVNREVKNLCERGEHMDMPRVLEKLVTNAKEVLMFPVHEYWLDIGRPDDYRRAQIDVLGLDI